MERRKILLGSGTVLATVLAGCSSETSDDDPGDGDGSDNGDSDGSDNGDGDGSDNGDGDGGENGIDDVPGFDGHDFGVDSEMITVETIKYKDDTVHVGATTELTDHEELYAEFETLADDVDDAAADLETFSAQVDTVEWDVRHGGETVLSFYVDVAWVVDYSEGAISADEFLENVRETAD